MLNMVFQSLQFFLQIQKKILIYPVYMSVYCELMEIIGILEPCSAS